MEPIVPSMVRKKKLPWLDEFRNWCYGSEAPKLIQQLSLELRAA